MFGGPHSLERPMTATKGVAGRPASTPEAPQQPGDLGEGRESERKTEGDIVLRKIWKSDIIAASALQRSYITKPPLI